MFKALNEEEIKFFKPLNEALYEWSQRWVGQPIKLQRYGAENVLVVGEAGRELQQRFGNNQLHKDYFRDLTVFEAAEQFRV